MSKYKTRPVKINLEAINAPDKVAEYIKQLDHNSPGNTKTYVPTKMNPKVTKTLDEITRYVKQLGLDPKSYLKLGDAHTLNSAVENSNSTEVLNAFKTKVKNTAQMDASWDAYVNTGREPNGVDPYQKGIGNFFNLPVPDTDGRNTETKKGSKLKHTINVAKKVAPAAVMGTLYLLSGAGQALASSPAAATPDTNNDDDDHHSPTDPAKYNDKDDISNFMEGLSDKIQEYSPIPVAAAAEDTPDPQEQGKPDLTVTNTRVEKIDGKDVITATIKNTGDKPVETYTIGIETADGKYYIGQRPKLGNLAPGETRDETINPNDCYCGKRILGELGGIGINVVVDEEDLIKESEEGNNVLRVQKPGDNATDEIPRLVNAAPGNPQADEYSSDRGAGEKAGLDEKGNGKGLDLAVVDTRVEKIDGKDVITATIKNTGDKPVETYTIGIETADGKYYIGQRPKLGNLAPGETRDETINPNDCYCGKRILGELGGIGINVVVDEEDLIKESEEGNNVLRVQKPGDNATSDMKLSGYGIGAAVTGTIAYIGHSLRKKRKSPANEPQKPVPEHKPEKQKPSALRGKMHSIRDYISSIREPLGGKMHNMKDSYDSLKQKIGERYETHRNKGNEGKPPKEDISATHKTKYIEEIKTVVSGLKHRTTRKRTRVGQNNKKITSGTGSAAALKEPNLDGLKKMLDANYGALGYTAYTSEEAKNEGGDIITIVPNMHLTKKEEEMLGEHLESTGPGYKYKVVKRELKSSGH